MVYNTQIYWGSGLRPSLGIKKYSNTTFRKRDLVQSSGEMRKTYILLGLLE
jgi:hypothetical protein